MALPVIVLRDFVLLPATLGPLSLARPESIAAVAAATAADSYVAVFTQRQSVLDNPGPEDLFEVGVRAIIRPLTSVGSSGSQVEVEGLERIWRTDTLSRNGHLWTDWKPFPLVPDESPEAAALFQLAVEGGQKLGKLPSNLDMEKLVQLALPDRLYLLAAGMRLSVAKTQDILEGPTHHELLQRLNRHLSFESQLRAAHQRLVDQAGKDLRKGESDAVLRQELANIQKELGDDPQAELCGLQEKLQAGGLPPEAHAEAERQLHLLERMAPMSTEYNVSRSYLELIVDLPWSAQTEESVDLAVARAVLEEDHFGLERVKERILEHLAVMKLSPGSHAPILCFVGPPGTGKTSLGKSIARALGRKFERLSLGGMHDEAELRGHRRTYVGAMTGRLIQAIRRCKVNNPLIMLDEIDKLRQSYEGDPAAALLEILDPAQNYAFHDNYLDVPFDLSGVFFITTANTLDSIPTPLLDRMEVIALSGYTADEKLGIAHRHLLPRLVVEAGLPGLDVPPETIQAVLAEYTREAGVRQLERGLARLLRRLALVVAEGGSPPTTVSPESARELLGPEKFPVSAARTHLEPGTAVGLAYTEAGGEVMYVEVAVLPKGEPVVLTGNLGEVMKESARTARSYLLSRYALEDAAVHIHVPAGATPKDGPSAGLAMVCALASALTGLPGRADTAMTGEITLSGLVLPVGGLKEKILSAQRAGLKRVIVPRANAGALSSLPPSVTSDLVLVMVDTVDEVLPQVILGFSGAITKRRCRPLSPKLSASVEW